MKLLYYCGGPGLNPFPEENILKDMYAEVGFDMKFWYVPSVLRPYGYPYSKDNAFQNFLDSAEDFFLSQYDGEPVVVIAYCFGCYPVQYLLQKYPSHISKLIIITPDFCLHQTDNNILSFIRNDYKLNQQEEEACKLDEVLQHYTGRFDDNTEQGYRIAAANPRFFDNYWKNEQCKDMFMQYYSGSYAVDVEGFVDVRKTKFDLGEAIIGIPVIALYGDSDIVISIEHELNELKKLFSNLKVIKIENASHFPHIEQPNVVLDIIRREVLEKQMIPS